MMKSEFERLAGYEVSHEDYTKIIEPMYMAISLSKAEFVKLLDPKRFSLEYKRKQRKNGLVKRMKELAAQMKAEAGHASAVETFEELHELAKTYTKEFPVIGATAEYDRAGSCGSTYIRSIIWYDDRSGAEVGRLTLAF